MTLYNPEKHYCTVCNAESHGKSLCVSCKRFALSFIARVPPQWSDIVGA